MKTDLSTRSQSLVLLPKDNHSSTFLGILFEIVCAYTSFICISLFIKKNQTHEVSYLYCLESHSFHISIYLREVLNQLYICFMAAQIYSSGVLCITSLIPYSWTFDCYCKWICTCLWRQVWIDLEHKLLEAHLLHQRGSTSEFSQIFKNCLPRRLHSIRL